MQRTLCACVHNHVLPERGGARRTPHRGSARGLAANDCALERTYYLGCEQDSLRGTCGITVIVSVQGLESTEYAMVVFETQEPFCLVSLVASALLVRLCAA
eukprot:6456768-Amphidinium_carterae.2